MHHILVALVIIVIQRLRNRFFELFSSFSIENWKENALHVPNAPTPPFSDAFQVHCLSVMLFRIARGFDYF